MGVVEAECEDEAEVEAVVAEEVAVEFDETFMDCNTDTTFVLLQVGDESEVEINGIN